MLSKVYSSGVIGIDGYEVVVECSGWDRVPRFDLVGLPDASVKEAKNRVQSACENSGIRFPALDIMVNLAPADVKKEGSAFDLPVAISLLLAEGSLQANADGIIFLGELALNGDLRPVSGVLPSIISARDKGFTKFIVCYVCTFR